MRICCEWLCYEPFIEEYPPSPAETSCVLKMCDGGLWELYLGRSQPSCTVDRFIKNLIMGILKIFKCSVAILISGSIPTYVSAQCYHMLQLLQPPTLVNCCTKSVAIWITARPRLQHASQSLLNDVYWQIGFLAVHDISIGDLVSH